MKENRGRRDLPLSEHQLQFWSSRELSRSGPPPELAVAFHFRSVDFARLALAVRRVVAEEPLLASIVRRTSEGGRLEASPFAPSVEEANLASAGVGELRAWIERWADRPLDPEKAQFEGALLRGPDGAATLLLKLHHLIADGWALGVLIERVKRAYDGEPSAAPPYGTFLERERRYLRSRAFRRDRAYWQTKLAIPAGPTDFYGTPSAPGRARAEKIARRLGPERTLRLAELAIRLDHRRPTLAQAAIVAAALLAYLHKLTGRETIAIGMPFLNRREEGERAVFGLFMQMGVARLKLVPAESLWTLVARLAEEIADVGSHVRYTIGNPGNRNFDVAFNFHTVRYPRFDDAPVREEWLHSANDEIPLVVHVRTSDPGDFSVELDVGGDPAWGERACAHFLKVLDDLLDDPGRSLEELSLLGAGEPGGGPLRGRRNPVPPALLHELFAAKVRENPDAEAVLDGASSLTFGALDERSSRLALRLASEGLEDREPVGVLLPRSAEAVVAVLGILKAGGVWVPLDPDYPEARLAAIARDAGIRRTITSRAIAASKGSLPGRIVRLDDEMPVGGALPRREATGGEGKNERPAYLLYTSGSTGSPKGVRGSHRAVLNRLQWMWREFPLESDEVLAHKTSLSFIDSVWEIFGALLAGRPLLVVPEGAVREPAGLVGLLADSRVRRLILVPSLLELLLESGLADRLPHIKLWFLTGEALGARLASDAARALPGARLFNLYGTTECYDAACLPVIVRDGGGAAPIGNPIDNTALWILDAELRAVPQGVRGELCVSGIGVPAGYSGAAAGGYPGRFVELDDPVDGPGRLYRTGDMARLRADGTVELCGRTDRQVKIQGHRIEPEEIERLLLSHPGIRLAAVVPDRGRALSAHVVPRRPLREEELARFLRGSLPSWMVPRLRIAARLPLTPSGKIDRLALGRRNGERAAGRPRRGPARPLSDSELALLAVWRRLLAVERIGPDDNFFDLGGHSLLALRMASEIERTFGRSIPVTAVFSSPTVSAFASRYLDGAPRREDSLVLLRSGGALPPLFTVPPAGSTVSSFAALARFIDPARAVYSFQPRGIEPGERPHRSIDEMAKAYLLHMRKVQPAGPYFVAGRCFGGYVAYEMARLLREAGEEVGLLAIMDSQEAPLEAGRQRSHVGLRKLLAYYPGRVAHFLKTGSLVFTLRMKAKIEVRHLLNRLANGFPRIGSSAGRRARSLQLLGYLHARAYHRYVARPYAGRIALFRAGRDPDQSGELSRWRRLARGGLDCFTISCSHRELLREPYLKEVARTLNRCLGAPEA